MKVYVVVEIWRGLIEETPPVIYRDIRDAKRHIEGFIPDNDEHEIHIFAVEIIEPRMVIKKRRRALARLEAICS